MEWEERKRREKWKRIIDREQTKGGGGRERRVRIHFTHAVTYISTSTPIIQYSLTPLVLTVMYSAL